MVNFKVLSDYSTRGGKATKMAQLIGDRVLPDRVVSMRRDLRSRVQDLREPVRRRRERLIPGPDVIGRVENRVTDLRNRLVTRESIVSRIRERRADSSESSDGDSSSSNTSPDSSRSEQLV